MLPVKVKMRRFNYTNLIVYQNLSCHTTWHQRSYQIALKKGNQNPQNNMITSFSFASTAHVAQWSNYLTQRAEVLGGRTTLWLICLWCLWYRSRFRHKASWLHSFLSWIPRHQQAAVASSLWMEVILANTSLLLNTLSKNMISWSGTRIDILAPSFPNRQKLLT